LSDPSGSLVPRQSAAGHRALLPVEVALCEAVGINAEEYFYFQQLSDAYNGKRAEEYDLAGVPEVSNDLTTIIINLVIGLALSAISMLLAPKPQQPKTPPSLKTDDVNGAKRYANYENFDSVQQLAALGEIIPLVFAHRDRKGTGGVRVKTLLLWSQLLSRGTGQQLKALMLLSMGRLATRPDFAGYAIGDQTLKNYTGSKVALYMRQGGGRVLESDRYSQGKLEASPATDVFTVWDDADARYEPWFSGTRTPSTQTQFGCYAPMSNGCRYRVTYELVINPEDADSEIREDNHTKIDKIRKNFPTRQGFITGTNGFNAVNSLLVFKISGDNESGKFEPWGVDDVKASIDDRRLLTDTLLTNGDQYLAGNALVNCESQGEFIWLPKLDKTFEFRVLEAGTCLVAGTDGIARPFDWQLQRVAIGTIANTRACDVTELGIKSVVWRQMNFPNVNSQPSDSKIKEYESKNGSIQLGQVNIYIKRFSFFRLQWRSLGTDGAWNDLSGGVPFAVRGLAPTAQYNFIRIRHPQRGQYEFRLLPVPGAEIYHNWQDRQVRLLAPGKKLETYRQDSFSVVYAGQPLSMTANEMSNPQWIKGRPPENTSSIVGFNISSTGTVPTGWTPVKVLYDIQTDYVYIGENAVNLSSEKGYRIVYDSQWIAYDANGDFKPKVEGNRRFNKGLIKQSDSGAKKYELVIEKVGEELPTDTWTLPVQGGTGTGATATVKKYSDGVLSWVIANGGSGYSLNDLVYIQPPGYGPIYMTASIPINSYIEDNLNPYDAVADYKIYDSESMSHESEPEHEVVYVNEQLQQLTTPTYDNLALVGLRLNSTKEWTSFQELSAYVRNGIEVERLCDDNGNPIAAGNRNATQNLPEIAYCLLTDEMIGAGKTVGKAAVNRERMQAAARFCYVNGFNFDGVIGIKLNLRDWIFQQAGYCLLDFTVLGGQFSLVPSVPVLPSGLIDYAAKPEIKALFTDGNIKDLKVTWLSPEERQLFKAVISLREEVNNGFARIRTVSMRLSNTQGGNDADPEENFDWSDWCCSVDHAILFAKYALKLRQLVDHGVTFTTTPASALGLSPGDYIRLVSEVTHTSRFNNGSIDSAGLITSTTTLSNGSYSVLAWQPGTIGVTTQTLSVTNGTTGQSGLYGTVFTLANTTTVSRVYKVESLTIGDEGFVEVAGSYQPITADGKLAALQWADSDFVLELG
jgi:hypothetical protein